MHTPPKQMTGVQLIGHGDLSQLQVNHSIDIPTPGLGDALIKVHAAGVNNTDLNLRTGWYSKSDQSSDDAGWQGNAIPFPLIQGADVCGTVVAVGPEADPQLVGCRVLVEPCFHERHGKQLDRPVYLGSDCHGGFAEYTTVPARYAHRINSTLTSTELASFPCSYSTAENLLTRAKVTAQDIVLITGASGGVGSAAIQLANARGARVIAVTSPSKADALLKLGAHRTVDRDSHLPDTVGTDSVDVVIDLVGGSHWPLLLNALKPFGRYATSGAIAGPIVELDLRTLYLKDLSLFGGTALSPEIFPALIQRIESGNISPLVAQTFPLAQIPEAQRAFECKQHIGKLVIEIA
ncbi:alcohol dehydrogenase family protein [Sulfuriroseicoccus oceanibius]|uniref:Alcohol dehydrogenase family protein n=1 Tax=Sulfuriroseicoccus oceanibius TaxID=2707525 RepID=A0A6B3LEW2_9BACT|nr:alcohol dehydrogenase family protein [Sulfuriroseicoccus oceanibius]QQL44905.1 alcohol dehydrogenase family protein [Sulfuriroseicoccus oceanibius]